MHKTDALRPKNYYDDGEFGKILLKRKISITRDKHIELLFSSANSSPFLIPSQPISCTVST
jgi:hypothetical protein